MNDNKSLKEFLRNLRDLTDANIIFLDDPTYEPKRKADPRYLGELQLVQNVINSFDFVKKNRRDDK